MILEVVESLIHFVENERVFLRLKSDIESQAFTASDSDNIVPILDLELKSML